MSFGSSLEPAGRMTVGEVRQQPPAALAKLTPFARTHSTLEHRPPDRGRRRPGTTNDWGAAALDLFMHEAQRVASKTDRFGQMPTYSPRASAIARSQFVGHRELPLVRMYRTRGSSVSATIFSTPARTARRYCPQTITSTP
jgi:hypothetical protein